MSFKPKTLEEAALEVVLDFFRNGLKQKSILDFKRKIANSLPPRIKSQLMQKLISDISLSDKLRLNCLEIFLNEKTKDFSFIQTPWDYPSGLSLIQMLPKLSPKIEKMNLSQIYMRPENKQDFRNLLKQCNNLKSLRVKCCPYECAIYQLLLTKEYDKLDRDVQIGLHKIEYINLDCRVNPADVAKLFKRLPELQGLGVFQDLGEGLSHYIDSYDHPNRTLNIVEIYDLNTSFETLENFAKFCPNANLISIDNPGEGVIENLHQFPLLSELHLYLFDTNELMRFLTQHGKKIKKLNLTNPLRRLNIDKSSLYSLCPELLELNMMKMPLGI